MKRAVLGVGAAAIAAFALAACDGDNGPASTAAPARLTPGPCGTYSGRGCAPAGRRVDLGVPSFSHSTKVTNPLFPISRLHSALLLGHVDGKPFRTETTLLPDARTVLWNGRRIPVLVSQYVAYLDGRLEEVALDRYAQADDGSVWYLGEDVYDYEMGTVALTEGTWLAGRDGPPAMIMPAHPQVGDAFRTENVPGIVFEEVTVKTVGKTVAGPRGPVQGAIVGQELHSDGTHENKVFAPGYGEFRTAGGGDLEAMALAVPADALTAPLPPALATLSTGAVGILESARLGDWKAVAAALVRTNAAWRAVAAGGQPPMVAARAGAVLASLRRAAKTRSARRTEQAAIDFAQSVLDLRLRYSRPAEVDVGRFHLWTQQLRVHAAARDRTGVAGDVAVLEWIRERISNMLRAGGRQEIETRLRDLRAASDAGNLPAAADHAARLGERLRALASP